MEDYNGINWSILSHASLLAMILDSFSMLLGTLDANNLHCAPYVAIEVQNSILTGRNIAKSSKCYTILPF